VSLVSSKIGTKSLRNEHPKSAVFGSKTAKKGCFGAENSTFGVFSIRKRPSESVHHPQSVKDPQNLAKYAVFDPILLALLYVRLTRLTRLTRLNPSSGTPQKEGPKRVPKIAISFHFWIIKGNRDSGPEDLPRTYWGTHWDLLGPAGDLRGSSQVELKGEVLGWSIGGEVSD